MCVCVFEREREGALVRGGEEGGRERERERERGRTWYVVCVYALAVYVPYLGHMRHIWDREGEPGTSCVCKHLQCTCHIWDI